MNMEGVSPKNLANHPPIHRLPPEILGSIFLDCVPDVPLPRTHPALFLLSRICSTWRSIAIQSPRLWSSFAFGILRIKRYGDTWGPPNPQLLRCFLVRSMACDLTLHTSIGMKGQNDQPSLDLFLAVSDRWRNLRLIFSGDALAQFEDIQSLPRLQMLHLREDRPFELVLTPTTRTFARAPLLRHVTLESIRHAAHYTFPVEQLGTLLFIHVVSWDQLPNLHHAHKIDSADSYVAPFPKPCIPLCESLHTMTLSGPTTIDHLITPALSVFDASRGSVSLPAISALLQRSNCALHALVLDAVAFRGPELIRLFPHMLSLRALTLSELLPYAITDAVLDALTLRTENEDPLSIHADRPPALPALEHLTIVGSYIFRDRALVTMLRSRAKTSALSTVDLTLRSRRVAPADVAQLRGFAERGVKLKLACLDTGKALVAVI
ncbi:hypothetical protein C8R44DRAFT_866045 [Mycena epipterygia]|nr:hypothetical protein C8R44DRAFT_866045 [Mycena epipterygia]